MVPQNCELVKNELANIRGVEAHTGLWLKGDNFTLAHCIDLE